MAATKRKKANLVEEAPVSTDPADEAESEHESEEGDEDEDEDSADSRADDEEVVSVDSAKSDDEDDDDDDESDDDGDKSAPFSSPTPSVSSPKSLARLDAMATYMREVQRHPRLSPEETQVLAVQFLETQDPSIAARLVTSNLRLVVKIAYEYRRAYKNIMDLVQEGNIGLMQAVKHYDPYRGVKLSSYSALWIRAYILRFILNNWRLVKLGTTQAQRKLFYNLNKKRAELQARGVDADHATIAQELGVTENDVAEMDVRLAQSERSLDAPVGDADGRSISRIDMMPSSNIGPDIAAEGSELHSILRDRLGEFRKTLIGRDKELAIFDERLVADEPLTLQELGDRFGVSRERVRQLEQRVTTRLREYLRRELGEGAEVL